MIRIYQKVVFLFQSWSNFLVKDFGIEFECFRNPRKNLGPESFAIS